MGEARAKGLSTRILLLLELHRQRHAKLKTLSERLGVTVQAVSVVLKRLVHDGLVENREGTWRPTARGTDALHGSMRDLRQFVDDAIGNLRLIDETDAQATATIKAGQEVGLYMEGGRLCAAPNVYASSTGIARAAARKGSLVRIGKLRGIVALKPAPILFVAHPETITVGQKRRAAALLRRTNGNGRLGAHDLTSAVLLEGFGREVDFEFSPLQAAVDAALRGVPVQYWVPVRNLPDCLATVAKANGSAPQPLTVRSVEL
jgi:predicted transcriptional regulator